MRFHNQVVLITGAARGQGRAHALAFANEGAHLILCDTDRHYSSVPYPLSTIDDVFVVAHEIENKGQQVLAMVADVTDSIAMQQLVNQAMNRFGHIDVVVANAGLYSFGLTWELTEQQWDETIAVVLKGVWVTCKTVIPHMLPRRSGKIIC